MDYDATWLAMGMASPLLNLIGFLIFSTIALCVADGSDNGGHRHRVPDARHARIYLPCLAMSRPAIAMPFFSGDRR
jgi:hypothetical protein